MRARIRLPVFLALLAAAIVLALTPAALADGPGAIVQAIRQMFQAPVQVVGAPTNGQVLGYSSSTGTWAAQSPSGFLAHSILSATHTDSVAASAVAGDVLIANSTPAWTRLPIGSASQVLTVSGGAPSWQTPAASTFPVAPSGGAYTTAAAGTRAVALGDTASAANNDTTMLGYGLTSTAINQVQIGSGGATGTLSFYLGNGVTHATPRAALIFGTGGTGSTDGASVTFRAGTGGSGGGAGGTSNFVGGAAGAGSVGGPVVLAGADSSTGTGAPVQINGGAGGGAAGGGPITVTTGAGGGTSGDSGALVLRTGTVTDGNSGSITIQTRDATGTNRTAGDLTYIAGNKTGSGTSGAHVWQVDGATEKARIVSGGGLQAQRTVTASGTTTPVTVTSTQARVFFTNSGATASITYNLPTAAAGLECTFYVQDADGLSVVAGASTTIRLAGNVSAAAGSVTSSTIGSCVRLVAISTTEWVAESFVGTWTVN